MKGFSYMMCVFWEAVKESSAGWEKKGGGSSIGIWHSGLDFGFPPFTRAGFFTGATVCSIEWG